jgi:hypothetical protein
VAAATTGTGTATGTTSGAFSVERKLVSKARLGKTRSTGLSFRTMGLRVSPDFATGFVSRLSKCCLITSKTKQMAMVAKEIAMTHSGRTADPTGFLEGSGILVFNTFPEMKFRVIGCSKSDESERDSVQPGNFFISPLARRTHIRSRLR